MISATVLNMAGKRLERELSAGSSILDMKKLLYCEWDVPPSFQIILRDSLATRDTDLITGDAVYSCVTSVEQGCKELPSLFDHAPEEVKVQSLKYLAKRPLRCNWLAIKAAASFLGDANINTRAEAMHTIAAVAEAGDQYVIRKLASAIEDQYDFDFDTVMMASIKGLVKIGSGDVSAQEAAQKKIDELQSKGARGLCHAVLVMQAAACALGIKLVKPTHAEQQSAQQACAYA